jgi:riboflavin kinase / FMN adenylyltransferase
VNITSPWLNIVVYINENYIKDSLICAIVAIVLIVPSSGSCDNTLIMMTSFQTILPYQNVPASLQRVVWAIGNFDGVHLGHRALLNAAQNMAQLRHISHAVMTFEPHPRLFFKPDEPLFRLTDTDTQKIILEKLGCSGLWLHAFDADLASMEPVHFLDHILLKQAKAAGIVVGENFRFGRHRAGDAAMLKEWCEAHEIGFAAVPPVHAGEEIVSSTLVRAALQQGNVARAHALLGEPWLIRSRVIHGEKRGRELGFPTLNMRLYPSCQLRHGIYAVRVRHDNQCLNGVASFGRRPTFDDGAPLLETYLFDFAGDLYGEVLDVAFIDWIRGEEKFDQVEALIAQMNLDAQKARLML